MSILRLDLMHMPAPASNDSATLLTMMQEFDDALRRMLEKRLQKDSKDPDVDLFLGTLELWSMSLNKKRANLITLLEGTHYTVPNSLVRLYKVDPQQPVPPSVREKWERLVQLFNWIPQYGRQVDQVRERCYPAAHQAWVSDRPADRRRTLATSSFSSVVRVGLAVFLCPNEEEEEASEV